MDEFQDRLRRYVDDDEMVKRIIFIAVCESFHVAKLAYRSFRLRARKLLSPIHGGPSSLEEAVSDYIVRNLDLYDVEKSVDVSEEIVSSNDEDLFSGCHPINERQSKDIFSSGM